jgi:hypothetical protein
VAGYIAQQLLRQAGEDALRHGARVWLSHLDEEASKQDTIMVHQTVHVCGHCKPRSACNVACVEGDVRCHATRQGPLSSK